MSAGEESGEERTPQLRPLRGGRHRLSPEVVAFNQRERLLAAAAASVAERGYNQVTVARITEAAQVSRRTFYEHFAGKEEIFLATYDVVDGHLSALMAEAAAAEQDWADQVAATFRTILGFFAGQPNLGRVYFVEATAVGEPTASRRAASADRIIELLRRGREVPGGREPGEGIEEALAGGIFTLISRRIVSGETEQLERFAPGLIEFALSPYLGPDEARRRASAAA